ncbi:MAG: hypothetical protein Q8O32_02150 [bacterium]|nr:hypothetical protein [bacterium]
MDNQIDPPNQTPRNSHKVLFVIFTFFITALLIGGAVYYYQQSKVSQAQKAVQELSSKTTTEIDSLKAEIKNLENELSATKAMQDDTLGQQTYSDEELGLSFRYPKDFTINDEGDLGKLFGASGGHFWLKVSDNIKDLKTAQGLKDDFYANNSYGYKYQDSFVTISGLDIYKQGRYDLGVIENYYFLLDDKIVKFNFEFNFDAKDQDLENKYKSLTADVVNSINYNSTYQTSLFDVTTAKVGDIVAGMTIKKINPFNSSFSSLTVDNAKVVFSGRATISGKYLYNDMLGQFCIDNIDANSQIYLPKINGDTRSASFCFSNKEEANSSLKTYQDSDSMTVIMDDYTIISYPSEVVNMAKFISVQ